MILVTGATGAFGSAVLKKIKEKKISSRAVALNDAFDWNKPETFENALKGIEKVFLVSPPNYRDFDKAIVPFLEKAKVEGVRFMVLSTVYGTDTDTESVFGKTEKVVANSGINFTIIRPNFIFQNFINYDLETIKSGMIYLPTKNSKTSYIDVNDIAEASTVILEDPKKHLGKTYTLTGAESLSHEQFAEIFSDVLQKEIINVAPSNDAYKAALLSYKVPKETVDFMGYLYAAIEMGVFASTTNDYELITGKKPIVAREFVQINRAVFLT